MAGGEGEKPVYSIGAVARMLDIPASTLRAWEERYGMVSPSRSAGAQRLYSRPQVEQLRFVKTQIDSGVSAADAHRLLAEELSGRPSTRPPAESRDRDQPLILIADKDPYAAELAEYFLRTEGWQVATALDAVEATLQMQEQSPAIVIVDLFISGGAGFRLLSEFAKAGKSQVVAVSAIDSADEAIRLGAAAFLIKPLEPLALVSTVRDLLGKSALTRVKRTVRS